MKIFLILFISIIFTTPCFAGQWLCIKYHVTGFAYDKTLNNKCETYSSFKLKRPKIRKSDRQYKYIVETFDDRRALSNCFNNFID